MALEGGKQKPLTVKAVDADSGENARITYSIVEASAKRDFEIDEETGRIITRQVSSIVHCNLFYGTLPYICIN